MFSRGPFGGSCTCDDCCNRTTNSPKGKGTTRILFKLSHRKRITPKKNRFSASALIGKGFCGHVRSSPGRTHVRKRRNQPTCHRGRPGASAPSSVVRYS